MALPERMKFGVFMAPFHWKGENPTLSLERDLETIEAALTVAETGHLAFATLHTNSCAQTINRIVDVFPSSQQSQVRAQLSFVLEGALTQTLLPQAGGRGRVLAVEVMAPNPAIRNLIREDKIHQIYSIMQTGQAESGMQTFNQSLADLYLRGKISMEMAMGRSTKQDELQELINRNVTLQSKDIRQSASTPDQRKKYAAGRKR